MLAFRRQHHQETATVLSDLDVTEQRVAELYTMAVEQLGSDNARVRFGGLHALERLAQDNPALPPDHRQRHLLLPAHAVLPNGADQQAGARGRRRPERAWH